MNMIYVNCKLSNNKEYNYNKNLQHQQVVSTSIRYVTLLTPVVKFLTRLTRQVPLMEHINSHRLLVDFVQLNISLSA